MKKNIILFGLLTASTLVSSLVQAADSVELTVKGVIRPVACSPSLSGNGLIDYGTIDAAQLSANQPTVLENKTLSFTVTCSGPATIALRLIDNRPGSAVPIIPNQLAGIGLNNEHVFGLGKVDQTNIGMYVIRMEKDSIAGVDATGTPIAAGGVAVISSIPGNAAWHPLLSPHFVASGVSGWKGFTSDLASSAPAAFSSLSGKLTITAMLDSGTNLPLQQDINLDGSSTLEVMYL